MEARMRAARAGGSTATLQHHREQLDGAGCSYQDSSGETQCVDQL
jgi:hypothetical protein